MAILESISKNLKLIIFLLLLVAIITLLISFGLKKTKSGSSGTISKSKPEINKTVDEPRFWTNKTVEEPRHEFNETTGIIEPRSHSAIHQSTPEYREIVNNTDEPTPGFEETSVASRFWSYRTTNVLFTDEPEVESNKTIYVLNKAENFQFSVNVSYDDRGENHVETEYSSYKGELKSITVPTSATNIVLEMRRLDTQQLFAAVKMAGILEDLCWNVQGGQSMPAEANEINCDKL